MTARLYVFRKASKHFKMFTIFAATKLLSRSPLYPLSVRMSGIVHMGKIRRKKNSRKLVVQEVIGVLDLLNVEIQQSFVDIRLHVCELVVHLKKQF